MREHLDDESRLDYRATLDALAAHGYQRSRRSLRDYLYHARRCGALPAAPGTGGAAQRPRDPSACAAVGDACAVPAGRTTGDAGAGMSAEYGRDRGTLTTKSRHIQTLDDALAAAEVDLDVWEVDRHKVNAWEVTMGGGGKEGAPPATYTNFQVTVFLKRRVPDVQHDAIAAAIESLSRPAPKLPPVKLDRGDLAATLALYDVHFGKLAWARETGTDYDLDSARRLFMKAVRDLLERLTRDPVQRIYLPLGQDFFQVDNWQGTSAKGTPQDVDGRFQKIFEVGVEAVVRAVDLCAQRAPEVDVLYVPGNHDPTTSYYLTKVIEARYHGSDRVTVDAGPAPRKYRRHGVCLIGHTHGNEEPHRDLPTIMADEVPEDWAASECREWLVGHVHKRKETRFLAGDTFGSVGVRVIPSLSGTDRWHYTKGYVRGRRAAEVYLWHARHGYDGHFTANVPVQEGRRA